MIGRYLKIEYVSTAFRDADGRLRVVIAKEPGKNIDDFWSFGAKVVAASEWDNGSFARIRTRLIRIDKWKNLL